MTAKQNSTININTASLDELTTVAGIGDKLAQEIIHHRPYSKLHDLVNVSGISETKLEALSPHLTVNIPKEKPTPSEKPSSQPKAAKKHPITKVGDTEAFVFLEDRNDQQDALLIIFGGFILGLIILLLRRKKH